MATVRAPVGSAARLYLTSTIDNLHDEVTYADKDSPTAAELQARDKAIAEKAYWQETCPVDVSQTGSTEEADDSDRCNPDSTVVTKVTNEITFNFKKRKDNSSLLPQWVKDLRNAWLNRDLVSILMLDAARTNVGADGFWILAAVTDFSENQPLTESIDISVTVKPGSTPVETAGQFTGLPYKNWDVITYLG